MALFRSLLISAVALFILSVWGSRATVALDATPTSDALVTYEGLIGADLIERPTSVAIGPDNTIWIPDQETDQVYVLSTTGELINAFGGKGEGPGEFDFANFGSVDIDADGNVYVLDSGNERVQKFSSSLEFLLEWGTYGRDAGEFLTPADVVVSDDGRVYVVDTSRRDVQQFDSSGKFVKFILPSGITTEFFEPVRAAIGPEGNLYVPDVTRVYIFDPSGALIRTITSSESDNGKVAVANGIAVTTDGHVFVSDIVNNRVAAFNTDGKFVGYFGDSGSGVGEFLEVDAMTFHPDGLILVLDFGNYRVQSYRINYFTPQETEATPT